MTTCLKGKNLTSLKEFNREEIMTILQTAQTLKIKNYSNESFQPLKGKVLGMIFQKPSLRTRVSFEVGMIQLGGQVIYLAPQDMQLGERESAEDVARVMGRYVDCIMARTFSHSIIVDLARYAGVPVINGLSDYTHPCQALADFQTILEKKGRLNGINMVFIGDGNNVCNSLLFISAKLGVNLTIATPKGYEPDKQVIRIAREHAKLSDGKIKLTNDPVNAIKNAEVVYTDVWVSMGQESEKARRLKDFKGFQVNIQLLDLADPNAIFLHCLPTHYGEETTRETVYDPRSAIFDQAENRLHAQKAVLALLM